MTRVLAGLAPRDGRCDAGCRATPIPLRSSATSSSATSRFESGESLPELKLHYRTIGQPRKDADGVVRNGILILHGTGGTGRSS